MQDGAVPKKAMPDSFISQLAMFKKIPKEEALKHINHYRNQLPRGSIKSVWLDREIIDFIARHAQDLSLSGLRVYMAKYKPAVQDGEISDATEEDPIQASNFTVIVAPTIAGLQGDMDMDDAYFNYGSPCPPGCSGDIGNS